MVAQGNLDDARWRNRVSASELYEILVALHRVSLRAAAEAELEVPR